MRNRMQFMDAQSAMAFLLSQATHIEAGVYAIQYPEVQYASLVPIDTSANPWVQSVTYFSSDGVGQAEWFNSRAKDIPLAEVERSMFQTGVAMAAIGYQYNLEELAQAQMLGQNLTDDKARFARLAAEQKIDRVALYGDETKGFEGLVSHSGVTIVNSEGEWGVGSAGDIQNILDDVNNALSGVYIDSNTVQFADTLLLPLQMFTLIASNPRSGTSDTTILEYIRQYNAYTALTGRPLTIRAVRGLETAGTASSGRMIVYRRDPTVLKMHIPMPFRFLPVWQIGPLVFDVPGIFRLGGVDVKQPAAIRYIDGIMPAPSA